MPKSNPELRALLKKVVSDAKADGFIHANTPRTCARLRVSAAREIQRTIDDYAVGVVNGFISGRGLDLKVCSEILEEEFNV